MKYHTRTIKLKLSPIASTPEEKTAIWKKLYSIQNDAWRAANWIASGQFLNDQLIRRIYARKKIDAKDKEAVKQVEDEFKEFFGTKRQATTEWDIKEKFPDLPSCVTNSLNQVVVASYNKEKLELSQGNRSLRTYRKTMPFTVHKKYLSFTSNDKGHDVTWTVRRNEKINFSIYYGADRANNRLTVQRILDGENDYSASQIQVLKRDVYLLLPVKEPNQELVLDSDLCVGVDLGIAVPAYVALSSGGPQRMAIGDVADFLKVRTQMQSRRRRIQRNLAAVKGGKGRTKKLKALETIKAKERNFVRQYNHMVSKKVVDFALKNRAGTVKMEMLEGYGQDQQNDFFLRNWSYFELQTMIADKAKRYSIAVHKIDPYHTSQTCSACGNYEEGQRDKDDKSRLFECKNIECHNKMNADHNAAINIARSTKIVTKKEQCEYYLKKDTSAGPTAEG